MNTHFIHPKDKTADESMVLTDECGDSIWDAMGGTISPAYISEMNLFFSRMTVKTNGYTF